jgi:hypothetical protein
MTRFCDDMRPLTAQKNRPAKRIFNYHILPLLIAVLGSILSGCASGRVAEPGSPYLSPETALRALASSDPGDRTLTAIARIEIKTHSERHVLKAALMMKRPAQLRLESIPLFGPPDFFLSIDTGEIRVFLPGKAAFYADRATEENLSRFLPLVLSATEMVSLLMGRLPEAKETGSVRKGKWEDGLYRVDQYRSGGKILSAWIDPAEGNLLRRIETYTEAGHVTNTAEFMEHAGEGSLPRRIKITQGAVSLDVRYTDVRLDDGGEPFALPVPEGITPRPFE